MNGAAKVPGNAESRVPWWKRLWRRIDAWLIETQHLYEMDDRDE